MDGHSPLKMQTVDGLYSNDASRRSAGGRREMRRCYFVLLCELPASGWSVTVTSVTGKSLKLMLRDCTRTKTLKEPLWGKTCDT